MNVDKAQAAIRLNPAPIGLSDGTIEIKHKGKAMLVPSTCIDGRTVLASGRWIRIAAVKDEKLVAGDAIPDTHALT